MDLNFVVREQQAISFDGCISSGWQCGKTCSTGRIGHSGRYKASGFACVGQHAATGQCDAKPRKGRLTERHLQGEVRADIVMCEDPINVALQPLSFGMCVIRVLVLSE